jgi:hypothetical protein
MIVILIICGRRKIRNLTLNLIKNPVINLTGFYCLYMTSDYSFTLSVAVSLVVVPDILVTVAL